jgi:hypothetical protein
LTVEGTVDLAFPEETPDFVGWTVVDFKTAGAGSGGAVRQ